MKKFLQTLALLTLVVWGVVFLYFYTSGRIERYLDTSFRLYALLSGIGFLLLAAFNFLTRNRAVGLCTHDHAHGDPCAHPEHQLAPKTSGGCGGGGHHAHEHKEGEHDHDHGCCGHDHEHDHSDCEHNHTGCGHDHDHNHAGCGHDHEESPASMAFTLLILLAPLLVATGYSTDKFSSEYVAKWGKIERQMMQMRIAEQRKKTAPAPTSQSPATPNPSDGVAQNTEGGDYPGQPGNAPAATEPKPDEALGSFTIEDLKKMVPQNEKGEFLLDVPQIFYTAGDRELMAVMEGIPVETTAQLMEESLNNPNRTRLKAFRLFIECCAADARPLSIPIEFGKTPPEYKEMGWYKIYGQIHYSNENDEVVPMILIERIEATSEPTDGLLF